MNSKERPIRTKTKPRLNQLHFKKSFDSFVEMVQDFVDMHPENASIFTSESCEAKDLMNCALDYFMDNQPNLATRENLPCSLSVSSNGALIKTAKYFSIGWYFKYDKEGNISSINANVVVFASKKNSEEINNMLDYLENNDWNVVEK